MDNKGISKLDLKRRNRKQILLAIRQAGMLARVDIAAQLSLTRAAVTIITNQMVSQNILVDLNTPMPDVEGEPKRKGRKKTMIRINPNYRYVLGAVVNEHYVSVGLSNLGNEVIGQDSLPISEDTPPEEIISFIVTTCRKLMKKASLNNKQMLGLGVGVVPARWEQMRAETKDHEVTFSKLCYLLEMELSIPVMAASAITLYALASTDYSTLSSGTQLMLYAGDTYHFAAVSEHQPLEACTFDSSSINRMVLIPGGEKCEGYPDGCVHAELGYSILAKRLKDAGKDIKPEEANALYEAGDEAVISVIDGQLDRVAVMIYNLCIATTSHRVTLQNYMPGEAIRQKLCEKVDALCTKPGVIRVVYSDIIGDQAFLAGCALAAEKQFYELGGLQPGETMA